MTLITQIRDGAVDSSVSLADLLRRALVLASLLRNDSLRAWAKRELDGYAASDALPTYRHIRAEVYGQFVDPYGRQVSNYRVPILALKIDPKVAHLVTDDLKFPHGIASLEQILATGGDEQGVIKFSVPSEMCMFIPTVIEGFDCVGLHRQVHKGQIRQILDSTRSQLLDLVLELAEKFPELYQTEAAAETVDKAVAAAVINNHIYGHSNVVASGSHFVQSVKQHVEPNDLNSLLAEVEQHGIKGKEGEELRVAIKDDGQRKDGKFGPRVAAWIGRTTQKLLETGMTAAPTLITEAVSRYYGWK